MSEQKITSSPSLEKMKGKDLDEAWMEYWNYNVSLDSAERISKIVFYDAFRYGKAFHNTEIERLREALNVATEALRTECYCAEDCHCDFCNHRARIQSILDKESK